MMEKNQGQREGRSAQGQECLFAQRWPPVREDEKICINYMNILHKPGLLYPLDINYPLKYHVLEVEVSVSCFAV